MTRVSLASIDAEDRPLLARAERFAELPTLADCTLESLAALASREGIDFATAVLYARVCRSDEQREFVEHIQEVDTPRPSPPTFRVVIVPGAFYKRYPHTGGDGRIIAEELRRLGYEVDVFPLPEFGSWRASAAQLAQWLNHDLAAPTVLVSLSKAGMEVREALRQADARPSAQNVVAWINLSGIVEGTAIVTWLKRQWWRWLALRCLLWVGGYSIETLAELERPAQLPSATVDRHAAGEPLTIHVTGFPRERHLSDAWARRGHKRLTALGPNDGGGILLADVVQRPGYVFPVWGADHYLRPDWDIRRLMARLVQFIEKERSCRTLIAR